ncbi:hypothetical protein PIGHUM_04737 [Pigmentiphaga humi]|uniref:Uncharacterized protein n=1 Tax=Pigmentiphaga humi TaxID=2478468 RepID=A0A3P4BBY9_9BURK|nr:hypothetical protein PIGHUM_04737 [Pigmentiphaga humi]
MLPEAGTVPAVAELLLLLGAALVDTVPVEALVPAVSLESGVALAALDAAPPLPPPPPTDCANTPAEFAPCVAIVPVLVTATVPAFPPPPPLPPRPNEAAALPPASAVLLAAPPVPPPPPIDCANTPSDCVPVVAMLPLLTTETAPPSPPTAPDPPRLTEAELLPPVAFELLEPPLPPPPPTDCANTPLDRSPVVLIAATVATLTVLPLPPSPPAPPMLSDAPMPLSAPDWFAGVLLLENFCAADTVALPAVLPTKPV